MITTTIYKKRWVWMDRRTGEERLYETHTKTWRIFGIPVWRRRKHCKIPWHLWATVTFLGGTVNVPDMHEE